MTTPVGKRMTVIGILIDGASIIPTAEVHKVIQEIGGDLDVGKDNQVIRAAMIEVIALREGTAASSAIMDAWGWAAA